MQIPSLEYERVEKLCNDLLADVKEGKVQAVIMAGIGNCDDPDCHEVHLLTGWRLPDMAFVLQDALFRGLLEIAKTKYHEYCMDKTTEVAVFAIPPKEEQN